MKKSLLTTALITAIGAIAFMPSAFAASTGTINISGQVVADTCAISVNGSSTSTVTLPTVTTNTLAAVGNTAGDTSFPIALTGCNSTLTTAKMTFSNTNVASNGNLSNTASSGSSAQVQLLSGSNVINLGNGTNAPTIAISGGTGSTTLTARYYANTANTTAGAVSTAANFTLTYN